MYIKKLILVAIKNKIIYNNKLTRYYQLPIVSLQLPCNYFHFERT